MSSNSKRSIVYIDGFNLFYGLLKNSPYKWLDLESYFKRLRNHDDLQAIKYFTARVKSEPADQTKPDRQQAYFDALGTTPIVDITLGTYQKRQRKCKVSACTFHTKKYNDYEEKKTDVNIALTMLDDAYQNACDLMILVSGDSDIVPAVQFIKHRFPNMEVRAYIPYYDRKSKGKRLPRGRTYQLNSVCDGVKPLPYNLLQHAQFSDPVIKSGGESISKPTVW